MDFVNITVNGINVKTNKNSVGNGKIRALGVAFATAIKDLKT